MSVNLCFFEGRLVADPEVKPYGTEGKNLCKFRLAVNRNVKNNDGTRTADFIPFVCFGSTAEFVRKYFQKGKPINIRGELHSSSWTGDDGQKHSRLEVLAQDASFVEKDNSKSDSGGSDGEVNTETPKADIKSDATPPGSSGDFFEMNEDASELPF